MAQDRFSPLLLGPMEVFRLGPCGRWQGNVAFLGLDVLLTILPSNLDIGNLLPPKWEPDLWEICSFFRGGPSRHMLVGGSAHRWFGNRPSTSTAVLTDPRVPRIRHCIQERDNGKLKSKHEASQAEREATQNEAIWLRDRIRDLEAELSIQVMERRCFAKS